MKETIGRRGIFSLRNFGSPYSWGVVASEVFSIKPASFIIFLVLSKLLTNLLTSLVVNVVGLVFKMFASFLIIQHLIKLVVIPL